ncbi:MAG TPA: hypothetical protein VHG91_12675 [Longimicrobium sp.]|nr:hypothetical protein [Longimicrobium sp.]
MKGARRWRAALLAMALAAGGAGCDSTPHVTSPDAPAEGRYHLRTVDHKLVPVVMQSDPAGRVELISGELYVRADRFTQNLYFSESVPAGSPATMRQSLTQGRISVNGEKVRFEVDGGGSFEGTLADLWIEYAIQGNTGPIEFIFAKE